MPVEPEVFGGRYADESGDVELGGEGDRIEDPDDERVAPAERDQGAGLGDAEALRCGDPEDRGGESGGGFWTESDRLAGIYASRPGKSDLSPALL